MKFGNSRFPKKRTKSGNGFYLQKAKRKSFKARSAERQYKVLGILRILLPVMMAAVLLLGITVSLAVYFSDKAKPVSSAGTDAAECFTPEQKAKLLQVVNKSNPLKEEDVPELIEYEHFQVHALCKKDLEQLMEAARADGIPLKIASAYVSGEEQRQLYLQKFSELKQKNQFTDIRAESETMKLVPKAGESESQTGLLFSFADAEESDFQKSKSFAWLSKYGVDYGFVLRYSKEKEEVTSMTYNPAVYRFVGKSNAMTMRILDMSLEEYAEYMEQK